MNHKPLELPNRLWLSFGTHPHSTRSTKTLTKNSRRLIEHLTNDLYKVNGKPPEEEFVTCGAYRFLMLT